MARPNVAELLTEDGHIVAEFDRAFAALAVGDVIERWWEWAPYGSDGRVGSFLWFRIASHGEVIGVLAPLVAREETRLEVIVAAERIGLGDIHGPEPARLADRCADVLAQWLVEYPDRSDLEPPIEPRDAIAAGTPWSHWPAPMPPEAATGAHAIQLRWLRGERAHVNQILDEELPRYADALRRLGE